MTAQQLKNSILQLAVQGKLVPQDEKDEPASELLKRIKAEKEKLIMDKIIKKEKALPEITQDELPFDIPESWEWVRLKEIVYNRGQMKPNCDFCYIDIGSINNKEQKLNINDNIITSDKAPSRARKIVDFGDIIYATVRPYLHNMCIIDRSFSSKPIASTGFAVMTCLKGVYNKFLFYYLLCPTFDNYANHTDNSKGVAYPAINDDRLYKAIIPLPPLAEQQRIVEKIEELLPLIEEYDKSHTQLEKLNKDFPEKIKKSVLQWAVQGKLVEQISTDEPASELVGRIKAEKEQLIKDKAIKKEKALPEITQDELPFYIPSSWEWKYVADIAFVTKLAGFEYTKYISPNLKTSGIPLFKGKNVQNGKLVNNFEAYIPESVSNELSRSQLTKKCLLTPYVGTIGNIAIFNGDFKAHLGSNVGKIEIFNSSKKINLHEEFVLHYLKSNFGFKQLIKYKKATAQESISIEAIRNVLIPLPPLAEQKRIVDKIESVFSVVDGLC